jgi:hypothetical protein
VAGIIHHDRDGDDLPLREADRLPRLGNTGPPPA